MIAEAKERLSGVRAAIAGIASMAIPLFIILSVSVLFAEKPIWLLAITVMSALVLGALVNPFLGLLVVFTLGMVGDLQHSEYLPSLSEMLVPCIAMGFGARSLAARRPVRTQLTMLLVLFFAMYCAGWFRAVDGIGDLVKPAIFAGYAAGFFLVLNIVRTKREIRMVFVAVAIGAALVSLALITQWLGIDTPLSLLSRSDLPMNSYQSAKGVERTLGFARDPNAAAYPCILAAPVLLALVSTAKGLWARVPIIALFGAVVLGLATTQSRSGALGFAASMAVFVLLAGVKGRYWFVLSLLILLGLAMMYMPANDFNSRFDTAQGDFESDRKIQYQVGLTLFVEHPLFGGGEEAFTAEMMSHGDGALQPHSNLLSVLTNSGLLGFVPFLCLILSYARFLFRHWGKVNDQTLKLYAAGAVAAVVGLHVQGFFIGNMGWFLLWAMSAIPICSLLLREDRIPTAAATGYVTNHGWRRTDCQSEISAL